MEGQEIKDGKNKIKKAVQKAGKRKKKKRKKEKTQVNKNKDN